MLQTLQKRYNINSAHVIALKDLITKYTVSFVEVSNVWLR
jgi:hypothetical protein